MKRNLPHRYETHSFDPSSVTHLTGDINYSYVHLASGEEVLTCRTLKWYAQQWPDFIRLHKKILVNPSYVQHYQQLKPTELSYVTLRDETQLPIARRRVDDVVQELERLLC